MFIIIICLSVTVDSVSRIIDSLKPKTSSGVDCISNKLIKYVKNVIMEPLTVIINQMLNVVFFQICCKSLRSSLHTKQ